MKAFRAVSLGVAASISLITMLGVSPAHASADCSTPTLVNGSFETFTRGTAPFAWSPDASVIGDWMNDWGTPKQFLFLDLTQAPQSLEGWQTTNSAHLVELQRQVAGFEQDGTNSAWGYFDGLAVQPAEGDVWAELNATEDAALYQDVTLTAGEEYTWSLKHHGRVFSIDGTDAMAVLIGPSGGTLDEQTSIQKYLPVNDDLFVGAPFYSDVSETVSAISGTISDGWIMYRGTFTPPTTGAYTFRFEGRGGWSPTVGNMLDDIEFAPSSCVSASTDGNPAFATPEAEITLSNTGLTNVNLFAGLAAVSVLVGGALVWILRRRKA